MALSMRRCEELGAPRCGASQAARDEAGARDKATPKDKATRRVALQPAHASSSVSTDAKHRPSPSSSPALDCKTMKSFENFSDGLLGSPALAMQCSIAVAVGYSLPQT
jgi:hypothetical protein